MAENATQQLWQICSDLRETRGYVTSQDVNIALANQGSALNQPEQLQLVRDLTELERRIDAYYDIYAKRDVGTLTDFERFVCEQEASNDLLVGKISAVPHWRRVFGVPVDSRNAVEVTVSEVLDKVHDLVLQQALHPGNDEYAATHDRLMEALFVFKKASIRQAADLGVVIRNFDLLLANLKEADEASRNSVSQFLADHRVKLALSVKQHVHNSMQELETTQGLPLSPSTARGLDYLRSQAALLTDGEQADGAEDPLACLTFNQKAALRETLGLQDPFTFEAVVDAFGARWRELTDVRGAGAHDGGNVHRAVQRLVQDICSSFTGQLATTQNIRRLSDAFWTKDFVSQTVLHLLVTALQRQAMPKQLAATGGNQATGFVEEQVADSTDAEAGKRQTVRLIADKVQALYNAVMANAGTKWDSGYVRNLRESVRRELSVPADKLKAMHTLVTFLLRDSGGEERSTSKKQASKSGTAGAVSAPRVTRAQLRSAVEDLSMGSSISALASLEASLIKRFSASRFSELGFGPSLLALLDSDPELLAAVVGTTDGSNMVAPLEHVVDVAAQAVRVLDAGDAGDAQDLREAAVSSAVCRHFCVPDVRQLGHGPARHITALSSTAKTGARLEIHSVAALSVSRNATPGADGSGAAGPATNEMAIACLEAAPSLSDLARCCQWEAAFRPSLGPLRDFLSTRGPIGNCIVLELPGGTLLKVPATAAVEDVAACASRGNAEGAAEALVSLVAQAGGVSRAPLALVAAAVEPCLVALAAQGGHRDDSEIGDLHSCITSSAGAGEASRFVLRCLVHVPEALLVGVAPAALLWPLSTLLGSPTAAYRSLLANCSTPYERSALHHLGLATGVDIWRTDFLATQKGTTINRPGNYPEVIDLSDIDMDMSRDSDDEGASAVPDPMDLLLHKQNASTAQLPGQVEEGHPPQERPYSPTATPAGQQEDHCRQYVETIRREEFGQNVQLEGEALAVWQRQNQRMGRALQRLSQELYSKDTHFVLELVQNADDNSYPGDVVPALEFVLSTDRVEVLNNESGFTQSNIKAMCDVGRSTKSKSVGYIGQKGIGFKSVFRVSDAPQIHSNGFHISFDLGKHHSLGYILPSWVDGGAPAPPPCTLPGLKNASTRIVLPLQSKLLGEAGLVLRQRFDDVHPTLLLFLHKLQCIAVTDAVAGQSTIMMKRQLPGGVVELRSGEKAENVAKWLLATEKFKPTTQRGDLHLDETQVSLAFNLDGPAPLQQQVFAYLPLRSYGLRFVVQADFVVPSSREAVDCDSAWNQMLRAQVPSLFLQVLETFQSLPAPENQPHYWMDRWLRCIPLDGEAQGFFAALPHAIAARLRASACIPTEDGHLVTPGAAMVCTSTAVRRLVSGQQLQEVLGLRFVHHDLEVLHSSAALRKLLGTPEFNSMQIVDLLKGLCDKKQLSSMGLPWLAALLATIFEEIETAASAPSSHQSMAAMRAQIMREMRRLPILPLANCAFFITIADCSPIFFPPGVTDLEHQATGPSRKGETEVAASDKSPARQLMQHLLQCGLRAELLGLTMLDPNLIGAVPEDRRVGLIQGLRRLGVKDLMPEDVMELHILPALRSPSVLTTAPNLCVGYLAFPLVTGLISAARVEQDGEPSALLSELCKCAALVLQDQRVVRTSTQLYLPESMGGLYNLNMCFPKFGWDIISDLYGTQFPALRRLWPWLMKQMGAQQLPAPVLKSYTTSAAALAMTPLGSQLQLSLEGDEDLQRWEVQDRVCADFVKLVEKLKELPDDVSKPKLTFLAEIMSTNWASHYASGLKARCRPATDTGSEWQELPSSFAMALRQLQWLPASNGCILAGPGLFSCEQSLIGLFGTGVVYLSTRISHPDMLAALGVISTLSVDVTLGVLRRWAAEPQQQVLSTPQMRGIYEYLAREAAASTEAHAKISAAVAEQPLVWLPLDPSHDEECGEWCHAGSLRLRDETGVAAVVPFAHKFQWRVLDKMYPHLAAFFSGLKDGQGAPLVQAEPSLEDYYNLLEAIVLQDLAFSSKHPQVLAVFSMWAERLQRGALPEEDVAVFADRLRSGSPCVPTSSAAFVLIAENVYLDDDPTSSQLFKGVADTKFIALSASGSATLPQQQRQRLQHTVSSPLAKLFLALGVCAFSQHVQRQLRVGDELQEAVLLPQLLLAAPPYVQRFLYHTLTPEEYASIAGQAAALAELLQVVVVHELELALRLPHQAKDEAAVHVKADAALNAGALYLTVTAATAPLLASICPEYSRVFNGGHVSVPVTNFLYALLLTLHDSPTAVEGYMEHNGAAQLPEGEAQWKSSGNLFLLFEEDEQDEDEEGAGGVAQAPAPQVSSKRPRPIDEEDDDSDDDDDPRRRHTLDVNAADCTAEADGSSPKRTCMDVVAAAAAASHPPRRASTEPPFGKMALRALLRQNQRQNTAGPGAKPSAEPNVARVLSRWGPQVAALPVASASLNILPSKDVLATGAAPPPQAVSNNHLVGLYGEHLIFEYLRNAPENQNNEVVWVNHPVETGLPYDIFIRRPDGDVIYVEVKSSFFAAKDEFTISFREMQWAAAHNANYHVYRVNNVGSTPTITRAVDPIRLWQGRRISVLMRLGYD